MELFKDKKTYLNATAAFKTHVPIIRTEGVRPHAVSLVVRLQDFLVRFLVFKGHVSKGV
jgi:hypothetical protein